MTQTAVARQAGLSRSFYAQVEHARQVISVDRAFAIANVLGIEMTELFTDFPAVPHSPALLTELPPPSTRSRPPDPRRRSRQPACSNGLSCQPLCPEHANLHAQTRRNRQITATPDAKLAAQSH
jgi:transcriptional regulator with XRE-family HTH domain